MKTQKSAMKIVLMKLSAVRVTLSPAEQKILDSLVVRGDEDEVFAHGMTTKVLAGKVAAGKVAAGKVATSKAAMSKIATTDAPEDEEVYAHAMTAMTAKTASGKAMSGKVLSGKVATSVRIILNTETGEYVEG